MPGFECKCTSRLQIGTISKPVFLSFFLHRKLGEGEVKKDKRLSVAPVPKEHHTPAPRQSLKEPVANTFVPVLGSHT